MWFLGGYFLGISDAEVSCLNSKRPDVWEEYVRTGHPATEGGPRAVFDDWFQWSMTHPGTVDSGSPLSQDYPAYDQSEWLYMVGIGCAGRTWFADAPSATIGALWSKRPDLARFYDAQGWFQDSQGAVRPITTGVKRMCLNDWWYKIQPGEFGQYNGDPANWALALLGGSGSSGAPPAGSGTGVPGVPATTLPPTVTGPIEGVKGWLTDPGPRRIIQPLPNWAVVAIGAGALVVLSKRA